MDIEQIITKMIIFFTYFIIIIFVIALMFGDKKTNTKKNDLLGTFFVLGARSLLFFALLLVITSMIKSCIGGNTSKKTNYTYNNNSGFYKKNQNSYRNNKVADQATDDFQKKQLKIMENRHKIDITLEAVKNNLEIVFKRNKRSDSTIISSKSSTGREEFCVSEKTCYYITYEPKTEKIVLLQMAFKYPETKKQINDFRNHLCLFLGMTNPNANFNDVESLITGLNIIFKKTTNIVSRNYIYENYMYSLYYNEDYDLLIITIQGKP